jgi:hypothetical protein
MRLLADKEPAPENISQFALKTFLKPHLYGTLAHMGSKDKGRKEVKKAPKPKPKPEPAQRREGFAPAPPPK